MENTERGPMFLDKRVPEEDEPTKKFITKGTNLEKAPLFKKAEAILEALQRHKHIAVKAPTGTGKSAILSILQIVEQGNKKFWW
jgi:HrpA-like RNA helicase